MVKNTVEKNITLKSAKKISKIDDGLQILIEGINILYMVWINDKDNYFRKPHKRYKLIKEYIKHKINQKKYK